MIGTVRVIAERRVTDSEEGDVKHNDTTDGDATEDEEVEAVAEEMTSTAGQNDHDIEAQSELMNNENTHDEGCNASTAASAESMVPNPTNSIRTAIKNLLRVDLWHTLYPPGPPYQHHLVLPKLCHPSK